MIDAILVTVSGITVLVEHFFGKFWPFLSIFLFFYAKSNDLWEKHDKIYQHSRKNLNSRWKVWNKCLSTDKKFGKWKTDIHVVSEQQQ